MTVTVLQGDCQNILMRIADSTFNCCITSPPYFGLRDYGIAGQAGLEATPAEYVDKMVIIFREVRRVLRDDGTLWLNLGDSYSHGGCGARNTERWPKQSRNDHRIVHSKKNSGVKPKDLMGIPWRVAFALQDDGWYLRQDIIWHKTNPMPESVRDRCTKAHEYMFLLSKNQNYYFDADAISEPCSPSSHARLSQDVQKQIGSLRANGGTRIHRPMKAVGRKFDPAKGNKNNPSFDAAMAIMPEKRNKRSVWTVSTKPFKGAHFATFPADLIEPCVAAGCPAEGYILDPFFGAGTTGVVANAKGRHCVGIELNPAYVELCKTRLGIS